MMKKLKPLLLLFFLAITSMSFTLTADWPVLDNNAFKVAFPTLPQEEIQEVNSAVGVLKMHLFMQNTEEPDKDENSVYSLIYTDYPDSIINSDNTELVPSILNGSIAGAAKRANGKILEQKDITIKSFPGREVKLDYNNGTAFIRMRFYLVKNRMYILQVITAVENDNNKSISRFLDSFLLK